MKSLAAILALTLATPALAGTITASNGIQVKHKVNEFTGKQSFEINRGATEPAWSVDCNPACEDPVMITGMEASSRTGYRTATVRGGSTIPLIDGGKVVGACDSYSCHVTQIVALIVPTFPEGGEVMLTGSAPDVVLKLDQRDYEALVEVSRGGG